MKDSAQRDSNSFLKLLLSQQLQQMYLLKNVQTSFKIEWYLAFLIPDFRLH